MVFGCVSGYICIAGGLKVPVFHNTVGDNCTLHLSTGATRKQHRTLPCSLNLDKTITVESIPNHEKLQGTDN